MFVTILDDLIIFSSRYQTEIIGGILFALLAYVLHILRKHWFDRFWKKVYQVSHNATIEAFQSTWDEGENLKGLVKDFKKEFQQYNKDFLNTSNSLTQQYQLFSHQVDNFSSFVQSKRLEVDKHSKALQVIEELLNSILGKQASLTAGPALEEMQHFNKKMEEFYPLFKEFTEKFRQVEQKERVSNLQLKEELSSQFNELHDAIESVSEDSSPESVFSFSPPPELKEDFQFLNPKFKIRRSAFKKREWKVAAFYNYKGGVGKTTLAFNIAHDLANTHHKRVLLIDVDPQSNLSLFTLVGEDADFRKYRQADWTVSKLFLESYRADTSPRLELKEAMIQKSIYEELVRIIPNRASQMNIEEYLVQWYCQERDPRDLWLELFQSSSLTYYDYILFDCPPNMGFMSQAALAASDAVFVPVVPSDFVRQAIGSMRERISEWREKLEDPTEPIHGILLNHLAFKDGEFTPESKKVIGDYKGDYQELLFPSHIPTAPGASISNLGEPLVSRVERRKRGRPNLQRKRVIEALKETTNSFIKRMENLKHSEN